MDGWLYPTPAFAGACLAHPPLTKGRKTTERGGKRRPFFLGSPLVGSPSFCQRITEHLQSSTLVIEDPGFFACIPRAIPWRHLRAPPGVAAPQSRTLFGGEDCLSAASSAALTFGTGAKAPGGPRPGAPGFGSFCRSKRTSACGAETPQSSTASCGAETPQVFLPQVARGRNPARASSPLLSSRT